MSSGDRFYQLQLKDRPAVWGDIGSNVRILGLVVGGCGSSTVLLLPGTGTLSYDGDHELTEQEWNDFICRSDDPEILIGNAKVFHRKLRYEISGAIQQKIWAADTFKCMYCGATMGKSSMTVDHFDPLELGGANDESNYLTACRACNKKKSNMSAEDWCDQRKLHVKWYREYLKNRRLP